MARKGVCGMRFLILSDLIVGFVVGFALMGWMQYSFVKTSSDEKFNAWVKANRK